MEQLNVSYYHLILRPVYIHDDNRCTRPFIWEPSKRPMQHFNARFIGEVYDALINLPPQPMSP